MHFGRGGFGCRNFPSGFGQGGFYGEGFGRRWGSLNGLEDLGNRRVNGAEGFNLERALGTDRLLKKIELRTGRRVGTKFVHHFFGLGGVHRTDGVGGAESGRDHGYL